MSIITAVTSGNGGAGKTMFASNMAASLGMRGGKVLLIDMNSGFRNLDMCFGLESDIIYDMADVVSGTCTLSKALNKDRRFKSLYLLSASQNASKKKITPVHMKKLCDALRTKFDHIIIDTPSPSSPEWIASVSTADRAVVLVTQEYVSLRNADTVTSKLVNAGINEIFGIINRVHDSDALRGDIIPSVSKTVEELLIPVAGIIQEDENIHIAMNGGIPVVCKKNTYIYKNFASMINSIYKGM